MNSIPLTLESIAARVTSLEQKMDKNSEDHGKIYAKIESVETLQAVTTTKLETIITTLNEVKADVKSFSEKPAKRWDALVTELIRNAAIAAFGYFIGKR